MSGVVYDEEFQPPPPPPPPADMTSEEGRQTAVQPPSSKEEVAKRNMAQDLLAKFMKQASTSSESVTKSPPGKRPRDVESSTVGGNVNSHFSGVHPSRRQRLVPQTQNVNAQMNIAGHHTNPGGNILNAGAYQSNLAGNQRDAGVFQMNAAAYQMNQQVNPNLYTQPTQDSAIEAHVFAGAGQRNHGTVSIPPQIFQIPPWSGYASQKFFFDVYAGPDKVHRFPIWTEKMLVVGRSPDCNIVVHHALVSRRHMVILFHEADGELMIYDLGSTHGSYLNDMSGVIPENDGLLPRARYIKLKMGWRIMFGKCVYQYALTSDGPNPNWRPATPAHQPRSAPARKRVTDSSSRDEGKLEEVR